MFRREEVKSRPGRPLVPPAVIGGRVFGTQYMLKATRSDSVSW